MRLAAIIAGLAVAYLMVDAYLDQRLLNAMNGAKPTTAAERIEASCQREFKHSGDKAVTACILAALTKIGAEDDRARIERVLRDAR